jgi:hypothetical protein
MHLDFTSAFSHFYETVPCPLTAPHGGWRIHNQIVSHKAAVFLCLRRGLPGFPEAFLPLHHSPSVAAGGSRRMPPFRVHRD